MGRTELDEAVHGFFEAWAGPSKAEQRPAAEALLEGAMKSGRAAWPDLAVEPAHFGRFLGRRAPADAGPAEALGRLCTADAWLICGCEAGLRPALARFVSCIGQVSRQVAARPPPADASELSQRVQHRLLVAPRGQPPRLSAWAALAPVEAWLQAVVIRLKIDMGRSAGDEPSLDELTLEALDASSPSPELSLMRARFQEVFRPAFRAALESLEIRDRNLVRMHLIDRVGLAQLAAHHGVHRATVVRWLAAARAAVLTETRSRVSQTLKVPPHEVESLIGHLKSQLDVSLGPLKLDDVEEEP